MDGVGRLRNDAKGTRMDDLRTILGNAIGDRLREKNTGRQGNAVGGAATRVTAVDVINTSFQHVLAAQEEVILRDDIRFDEIAVGVEVSKNLVADSGGDVVNLGESDLTKDVLMSGIRALDVGDKSQNTTVGRTKTLLGVVSLIGTKLRRRRLRTGALRGSMAISGIRDSGNVARAGLDLRASDGITGGQRLGHLLKWKVKLHICIGNA